MRKVGQLEFGVMRFAFGHQVEERVDELVQVGAADGAHGEGLELTDVGGFACFGMGSFFGRQVGLVDDRDFWDARGVKQAADVRFFGAWFARWIHDVDHGIYALERLADKIIQDFGDAVFAAEEYSRRIDEHDLAARIMQDAADGVAGGLWLGRDDSDLAPDERVQKRGLAHIGPPSKRDETGFHTVSIAEKRRNGRA